MMIMCRMGGASPISRLRDRTRDTHHRRPCHGRDDGYRRTGVNARSSPPILQDNTPEAGFTVVELLVALTLLSFLSVALFGTLRFGFTAWTRGGAHAEATEQTAMVQDLLRRLIADAYPFFLSTDPRNLRIAFDGTSQSLALLAPTPIAIGGGGRSNFVLSAQRHGDRVDLVIAAKPELAEGTSIKKTLLADSQAVAFSYFGRRRSDPGAQWHDAWTGETEMPALVRVQIRFAADDARVWPELVVAPRIAADVACVYDTLTKHCRGR
jgi:general secretion pathway protein J